VTACLWIIKMGFYDPAKPGFAALVKQGRGFTLVELLVVISVVSLLMGILVPALGKIRRYAKSVVCMSNERQIVMAVNCFTLDNDQRYPPSVATKPSGSSSWGWQEPMLITAAKRRPYQQFRSMSAYLHCYLENAGALFCPSSPHKYEFLQQAWDVGENWSHPESLPPPQADILSGSYCFYWGYVGYLGMGQPPFCGPLTTAGGLGQSTLLVTDYFGFGHWRNHIAYNGNCNAFGSSEKFDNSAITPGYICSSDFWSRPGTINEVYRDTFKVKLHAGYTDGHVETYLPEETVPMRVARKPDGTNPYPPKTSKSPGNFFIPKKALP